MKKILTALLLTILALSVTVRAEEEEISIDGEWYIVDYFYELGTANKDEDGNYHVVRHNRDYTFNAYGMQTLNEKYSIYRTEPEQGELFQCYVFCDLGEECICYFSSLIDRDTPVFFFDGNIYEYGIDKDKNGTEDEMLHYTLTDDTLYIMQGNSYTKAEVAKLGKTILMCEFNDSTSEGEELDMRDKMKLFVSPSVLKGEGADQDVAE